MSKIKVLVVPSDKFGSGKFRSLDPHTKLNYDDFFVDINYTPNWDDEAFLKEYQIVHIHRQLLPDFARTEEVIKKLKALGIRVVVDTDDYWQLDTHHHNYKTFSELKIGSHIIAALRNADLVTVPTTIIADELKNIGVKNVLVLPNAIDPKEDQFTAKPTESEILRFGWLGGSSHLYDVELLKNIPYQGQPFQFVLCGFDTRGVVTEKNPETGEVTQRPINPLETVWFNYEVFVTEGYEVIKDDKQYMEHLFKFKDEPFDDAKKPYRRIFTRPVQLYAKGYNEFDVALAPLKDTKFNRYKSQLKVIEAGFLNKALIASNYGPYKIDLVHGKNALLVEPNKNHKQWQKYVSQLVKNPNQVQDLAAALNETVRDKYNIHNINKTRSDAYKHLVNG